MAATPELLAKVGKLLALANDSDNEESRTAAKNAVALMKEYRLVLVPQDEIDRIKKVVGEANTLAKKYESEGQQKMLFAGLAGYMFAKKGGL